MDLSKITKSVLREDSLDGILMSKLGLDQQLASELVRQLDFSKYLKVQKALEMDDISAVAQLLGVDNLQQEETNPYTVARAPAAPTSPTSPQNSEMPEIDALDLGDEINTSKGAAKISKVNKLGDKTTFTTDKNTQLTTSDHIDPVLDITNPTDAQNEIDRIKKLAGIEDDSMEEAGTMKGGAIASGAMSGALMGAGKLAKLTHKNMKPGPKPKKKR